MSVVSFALTMRRHLIRLASAAVFTSSRLAKFGWVPFAVWNAWRRNRTENLRTVSENSGPIFTRLWTKVHKIFRRCRRPLVLSNALVQLSMSRFIQELFAIKSRSRRKTEQMHTDFWSPIFLGGTTQTFLRQIVSAIYCPPFGKV